MRPTGDVAECRRHFLSAENAGRWGLGRCGLDAPTAQLLLAQRRSDRAAAGDADKSSAETNVRFFIGAKLSFGSPLNNRPRVARLANCRSISILPETTPNGRGLSASGSGRVSHNSGQKIASLALSLGASRDFEVS
jgi:hypothetical protein